VALSVIGAGFGRTGTHSMKLALETLGFGPCHHMACVLGDPEQVALWRRAARGDLPDWDAAYSGFNSAVDWPTAHYWRELAQHWPEAKILLTVRSPESWYESMSKTIWPVIQPGNDPESFGVRVIGQATFGGRFADRAHAISVYEEHNATVEAALPPERLLVFKLGDGWEPLCRFLGRPVPDIPFPRTNSADEFAAMMQTN
jgi:hypothetical protein